MAIVAEASRGLDGGSGAPTGVRHRCVDDLHVRAGGGRVALHREEAERVRVCVFKLTVVGHGHGRDVRGRR